MPEATVRVSLQCQMPHVGYYVSEGAVSVLCQYLRSLCDNYMSIRSHSEDMMSTRGHIEGIGFVSQVTLKK